MKKLLPLLAVLALFTACVAPVTQPQAPVEVTRIVKETQIVEGAAVTRGQVIATAGNSGTPGSVDSQTYDVHLHLELWFGDHFVGQFLRPIEAREWLEKMLR